MTLIGYVFYPVLRDGQIEEVINAREVLPLEFRQPTFGYPALGEAVDIADGEPCGLHDGIVLCSP
eukprot:CAMPEP_0115890290 /NCGR_PEP_ID=MMETSP0287-20121206/33274_1 /TAXON_ID=412157 /ORGANISM="Chrysochromulina rotalis, Strain UIO044" /LENGTH=64 /DNA_ID=CAMNT_0003347055 /DNA_START=76 /DNA_END=266 /DNA_ORIENTATION=+